MKKFIVIAVTGLALAFPAFSQAADEMKDDKEGEMMEEEGGAMEEEGGAMEEEEGAMGEEGDEMKEGK